MSGGGFVGRNSGRRGGRHEVRPRRQEHSIRSSQVGVGCGQSVEAISGMSVGDVPPAEFEAQYYEQAKVA